MHPSVLLVTLDTTRADHLGAYGHADAHTPHLDALAARGLRFDRAVAPAPLTIPSHASLLTGLYPPHHGVLDNGDQRLSEDALTLAEVLQASGRRSHAVVAAYVTQAHWGFAQGFDSYDDDLGVPSDRLGWRVERPANEVVDQALEALETRPDLLWVHLFDAHAPYQPPPPFDAELQDPYDGELAFIDQQLGRLLEAVPEDSLVVVIGDHGESMGEGGEQEHGILLTPGVTHVPLIIAGPGVEPGVVQAPASAVDVMPTVLGWLDLDPPEGLDGIDLLAGEPSRPGVFSGAWYGRFHYGWTPLLGVTTSTGRLVRGSRDEVEGQVEPAAVAFLEEAAGWTPAWQPAPLTLDAEQLGQLQALGYMAAPAPSDLDAEDVDPRDGVPRLRVLHESPAQSPAELEAQLRALLEQMPGMRDLRLRLASLLQRTGRLDQALAEVTTAHLSAGSSTTALLAGDLWLQLGQPAEALSWFDEALELDPRAARAQAGRVSALARLGRLDQARLAAAAGLGLSPDDPRLILASAELALVSGEPVDPWRPRVAQLIEARPWLSGVHLVAAAIERRSGAPQRAEEYLREELRWHPLSLQARLQLVELLREQGRHLDVVKTLRPLVDLDPDNPLWQAETARAYVDMGRGDLAVPFLEACQDHPACPQVP